MMHYEKDGILFTTLAVEMEDFLDIPGCDQVYWRPACFDLSEVFAIHDVGDDPEFVTSDEFLNTSILYTRNKDVFNIGMPFDQLQKVWVGYMNQHRTQIYNSRKN